MILLVETWLHDSLRLPRSIEHYGWWCV